MIAHRSFFTRIFVSLVFLSQLILGIPSLGFAATPHACNTTVNPFAHLGFHIGSVSTFTWTFHIACPTNSFANRWDLIVKNFQTNATLCSKTNANIPNDSLPSCPTAPVMKVIIQFDGSMTGMNHTENFFSP